MRSVLKGLGITALVLFVAYWWVVCLTPSSNDYSDAEYATILYGEVAQGR